MDITRFVELSRTVDQVKLQLAEITRDYERTTQSVENAVKHLCTLLDRVQDDLGRFQREFSAATPSYTLDTEKLSWAVSQAVSQAIAQNLRGSIIAPSSRPTTPAMG